MLTVRHSFRSAELGRHSTERVLSKATKTVLNLSNHLQRLQQRNNQATVITTGETRFASVATPLWSLRPAKLACHASVATTFLVIATSETRLSSERSTKTFSFRISTHYFLDDDRVETPDMFAGCGKVY